MNRAEIIHENFTRRIMAGDLPAAGRDLKPDAAGLADREVADLFESQVMSRLLDIVSRRLRSRSPEWLAMEAS